MSAGKGAALQVRMGASQLAAFRSYADQNETTMSALVLGWIEAALAGTPPASVSPTGAGGPEVLTLCENLSLPSSGEVLAELKTQTALLQALVSQAAATPYGGTRAQRRSESEPEVMAGGLMSAADFASPPAPSVPDGYCPAEDAGMAELAQGAEVWMNGLGCTGTVKSPPTQGVYLIQPADRRLGAQHLHIRDLSIRNA